MFEVANGLVRLTFLGGHHSKIVPRFRIVRTELYRLLEVLPRAVETVSPEIECSQIVIGLGILRLAGDNLLEGRRRLFQIAALKHRHPVGEVVPLERTLVEHSARVRSKDRKSTRLNSSHT